MAQTSRRAFVIIGSCRPFSTEIRLRTVYPEVSASFIWFRLFANRARLRRNPKMAAGEPEIMGIFSAENARWGLPDEWGCTKGLSPQPCSDINAAMNSPTLAPRALTIRTARPTRGSAFPLSMR